MGLIFDSCIWVALASGQMDQERLVALAGEEPVFISAVSLGELRFDSADSGVGRHAPS